MWVREVSWRDAAPDQSSGVMAGVAACRTDVQRRASALDVVQLHASRDVDAVKDLLELRAGEFPDTDTSFQCLSPAERPSAVQLT